MKLSVIIVNYNVKYFLEQCLKSVMAAAEGIDLEVFVVDNNSVDGSVEMIRNKFPKVRLVANKENLGFSKANNQAIQQASGQYILLLNPDTLVEQDTFHKVLAFADRTPDMGGLGVKMIDGQGKFLPESKRGLPTPAVAFYKIFGLSALFPRSKVFGQYHLGYLDADQIHAVEVLSGAFMLLRRTTLEKTGLLDENFFMYGEDIDLSYRITKAGYRNYYFPQTRIIHYKGESTKKSSINYVMVFYNAMIIFARKHFSSRNASIFSFLINLAVYFRAAVAILNRFIQRIVRPLTDAILVYAGFYYIKGWWEHNILQYDQSYYPAQYMLYVVPAYILIWLFAVFISGGYDRPFKAFRLARGLALGTIIILVIYALLPDSLRFSRALILLGSIWALAAMFMSRAITHLVFFQNLRLENRDHQRLLIAGSGQEPHRIARMLRQSGNTAFIGLVSTQPLEKPEEGYIGNMQQIKELIEIYKVDELIFCASEIPSQEIINYMSGLQPLPVNFKIAPPESLYIIGSNSIDTFGSLFAVNVHAINKIANRRNKKLFDLLVASALFLAYPLIFWLMRSPLGLFKNILMVAIGKRTWVGYTPMAQNKMLPPLKKAILSTADAYGNSQLEPQTLYNLNSLYAKEYRVENDLHILFRAFRKLGQQV